MYKAMKIGTFVLGLTAVLGAAPVAAQGLQWDDRFFVNISAGLQAGAQDVEQTLTFPLYEEEATVRAPHEIDNGVAVSFEGGARVSGNFAVGVSITRFSNTSDVAVQASLPHPAFINSPRDVTVTANDMSHSELGVHLQALYMVPLGPRTELAISAGPSIFSIGHDLVSGVTLGPEAPPFNANVERVDVAESSETAVGFNVGVDWVYTLREASDASSAPGYGFGITGRFTRASTDVEDAAGNSVELNAGGFQILAGLRLRWR